MTTAPTPHPATARYAVGIDLGTSHTVVASVPLHGGPGDIALLPIPQRTTASEVQALPMLPSVRYQAAPGELGDAWRQPWPPLGASDEAPAQDSGLSSPATHPTFLPIRWPYAIRPPSSSSGKTWGSTSSVSGKWCAPTSNPRNAPDDPTPTPGS